MGFCLVGLILVSFVCGLVCVCCGCFLFSFFSFLSANYI